MQFNPFYQERVTPFWAAADVLRHEFDLGNGHFIQRIRRAWGIEPGALPHGCIVVPEARIRQGQTVLHLEPGAHASWQRRNLHSRAREIYPESLEVLQKFVLNHPEMHFIEVGSRFSGLHDVEDFTGRQLEVTIRRMAECEYFIGIISGPLHIAAALGLRCVTIINFPAAHEIYLPTLKDIDLVESEWFYPQSVLLHQEGEGPLVPRFSDDNLDRALQGEVYPYWSDRYLPLIFEEI